MAIEIHYTTMIPRILVSEVIINNSSGCRIFPHYYNYKEAYEGALTVANSQSRFRRAGTAATFVPYENNLHSQSM